MSLLHPVVPVENEEEVYKHITPTQASYRNFWNTTSGKYKCLLCKKETRFGNVKSRDNHFDKEHPFVRRHLQIYVKTTAPRTYKSPAGELLHEEEEGDDDEIEELDDDVMIDEPPSKKDQEEEEKAPGLSPVSSSSSEMSETSIVTRKSTIDEIWTAYKQEVEICRALEEQHAIEFQKVKEAKSLVWDIYVRQRKIKELREKAHQNFVENFSEIGKILRILKNAEEKLKIEEARALDPEYGEPSNKKMKVGEED